MKKISAVIFDMDGLLIDTEVASQIAWKGAVAQIGKSIDDEVLRGLIGCHIDDWITTLGEHFEMDLTEIDFLKKYDDIYLSNFMRNGIDVKPGVIPLLNSMAEKKVPRAVATSSEKHLAPRKLRLAGLEQFFDLIVTGCEVEKSKPEPEIYLMAAKKLGVDPAECLVFEDSYNGIRAAHRAGMNPVMIPDLLKPTTEMEELATGIFSSLEEAEPFLFDLLKI